MQTYVEIEMVRNPNGVWMAPWELRRQATRVHPQAETTTMQHEPVPSQKSRSWKDTFRNFLSSWKVELPPVSQPAA